MLDLVFKGSSGKPLRILCLGAHSDDIEIGCGGTLMKLVSERKDLEIHWVVFGASRERAQEASRSASALLRRVKHKSIVIKSFRDGFFPFLGDQIKIYFETLKADFAPDLIFTHYRDDLHQDHRIVSQLTWNTFRNHLILEYEIPKYDGDLRSPNFYSPLPRNIQARKIRHLQRHFGTQHSKHWFSDGLFSGLMRIRGMESCAPDGFAEGFYLHKAVFSG